MKKIKVVSAKEMARIESLAYAKGCNEFAFMERAGSFVAQYVECFVEKHHLVQRVCVLAGKGNNAGDGYVAALKLLERGFQVDLFSLYPSAQYSTLCHHQFERFLKEGGKVHFIYECDDLMIPQEGLILDALVGTGFKGQAGGVLAEVIERANSAKLPILSIDIPSGLCGNTGRVGTVAIVATETLYLELPKIGFFLREGWEHVGRLVRGQFGLPAEYMDLAEEEAFLVEEAKDLLPPVRKTRNKYEAGYVLTLAGSEDFVGAGLLASYAALRSGAGIVRWFYPAEAQMGASFAPWELIKEPLEGLGVQRILEEMQRASSLIIGPGIGRDKESFKRAKAVLLKCTIPVVIDADALFFLSKHPSFPLPKNSLLTPHQGELKRLLEAESLPTEEWISSSRLLADKKEVHILVKGAPNFLFVPRSSPYILPCGNPGLATAGTGDVLAGVLGALLAQKLSCFEAAILGCLLHGIAGDEACKEKTSFCMVATDVLESLPKAFSNFL